MTDWRDEHETYGHTESPIILELQNKIAILIAERDEARRMYCKCHAQAEAIGYAEGRGWDCFKKDGK